MIQRRRVVDEIRAKGFTYGGETKRTQMYRKPGQTHRIAVPRSALLEEVQVRSMLRQAGYSPADIEEFIRRCQKDVA